LILNPEGVAGTAWRKKNMKARAAQQRYAAAAAGERATELQGTVVAGE
jgi:hypothetical protein